MTLFSAPIISLLKDPHSGCLCLVLGRYFVFISLDSGSPESIPREKKKKKTEMKLMKGDDQMTAFGVFLNNTLNR